jgi:hypothetical protein
MTMIAKILVFVQFGVSLVLATAAFMLYTNRLDWTANPSKNEQPAGLLNQREEEYKMVCENGLRPADARHRAQLAQIQAKENRRPGEQAWYAVELQHLATGATDGKFCQRVKRDTNKQVPKPTGQNSPPYLEMERPKGFDNMDVDLHSLQYYERKCNAILKDIDAQLAIIDKMAKEEKAFTVQLSGDKGVHNRTRDEKIKKGLVIQEYKDLKPDWINTIVELNNLEQLRTRLTERLTELREPTSTSP